MVLSPLHHHVFHLPSVWAKTLAKNKFNQRNEKMQKESSWIEKIMSSIIKQRQAPIVLEEELKVLVFV